jgi:hypothetical protein
MTHLGARRIRVKRKQLQRGFLCGALLLCCGFFPAQAHAQTQTSPPAIAASLGQILGADVSVIAPSNAVTNGSMQAVEFSSGSTIVVHSGKARVEFTRGGDLDVCGPAKFTVLSSGEAITVALSFGRVHARFDALRPVTIYTPMIVATPLALGDQPRDATVGLTNTGTMCVLTASGAVRLQNQLTSETVIVPQPSEVLVQGASFGTLPAAVGQCRCDFDESSAQQAAPAAPVASAAATPSLKSPKQPAPASTAPSVLSSPQPPTVSAPQTLSSQPATKNPPAPKASSESSAAQTAATQPILKVKLPPIGYDTRSATATAEPLSVATLMLAQEAVVQPEWVFHGTVVASGVAPGNKQNAPHPKRGFWTKLRDFLTGSH